MIKSSDLTFDNPVFKELVTESLFPYYPGSVKAPVNKPFFDDQQTEKMKSSAEKPVPTTAATPVSPTAKARPATNTSGNGMTSVDD
jgi:hypothetical protein